MKETWDKTMPEKRDQCARAEDLIAYLYKEATPAEAIDFENHMQRCASCRAEMAAFGDVREAITDWRQQALGTLSSPAFEAHPATAFVSMSEAPKQRRSALAALREFFTLSPGWMRAAAAAVVLVFFTLAVIAITHLAEQPKVVFVEKPAETKTAQESNKEEVAGTATSSQETAVNPKAQPVITSKATVANNNEKRALRQIKIGTQGTQQLVKQRKQILPRNITKPSEQLASANDFLPFTAPGREEKLPSLVDLVDEPN